MVTHVTYVLLSYWFIWVDVWKGRYSVYMNHWSCPSNDCLNWLDHLHQHNAWLCHSLWLRMLLPIFTFSMEIPIFAAIFQSFYAKHSPGSSAHLYCILLVYSFAGLACVALHSSQWSPEAAMGFKGFSCLGNVADPRICCVVYLSIEYFRYYALFALFCLQLSTFCRSFFKNTIGLSRYKGTVV